MITNKQTADKLNVNNIGQHISSQFAHEDIYATYAMSPVSIISNIMKQWVLEDGEESPDEPNSDSETLRTINGEESPDEPNTEINMRPLPFLARFPEKLKAVDQQLHKFHPAKHSSQDSEEGNSIVVNFTVVEIVTKTTETTVIGHLETSSTSGTFTLSSTDTQKNAKTTTYKAVFNYAT